MSNERVNIIGRDGSVSSVPLENLEAAKKLGYRTELPEETAIREYVKDNDNLKGSLQVAATQFANQFTLGVSDTIDEHYQTDYQRAQKEALARAHSTANILGGVAGVGANLALTGGLGEIGKGAQVAKGAGEIALEQAGKKAIAQGVTQGVAGKLIADGAVKAAAEAAAPQLADRIVTSATKLGMEGAYYSAPKAITEAALGDYDRAAETLMVGVGAGAILGATGPLAKEFLGISKKVGGGLIGDLPSKLRKGAAELVPEVEMLGRETADRLTNATKEMAGEGVFSFKGGAPTSKTILGRLERINDLAGRERDGLFVQLDKAIAEHPDLAADAFNPKSFVEKLTDFANKSGHEELIQEAQGIAKALEKTEAGGLKFSEVSTMKKLMPGKHTGWDANISDAANLMRNKANDLFQGEINAAAERVANRLGDNALAGKLADTSRLADNSEALLKFIDRKKVSDRFFGQEANELIGTGLGYHAGRSVLQGATAGAGLGMLGNAGLWAAGAVAAKKALSGSVGKAALAAALDKAGILFSEKSLAHVGKQLDMIPAVLRNQAIIHSGESGFLKWATSKSDEVSKESMKKDRYAQFTRISEELTKMNTDPRAMEQLASFTNPISNGAPTVAQQYYNKMWQMYQYLYNIMPKNQMTHVPFKREGSWRPTDQELHQFAKVVNVMEHPVSIIDEIMKGTATKDQITALQTVYPTLYGDITERIAQAEADKKIKLSYAQRVQMSMLMGGQGQEPSVSSVATYQATYKPVKDGQTQKLQLTSPNTGNPYLTAFQKVGLNK